MTFGILVCGDSISLGRGESPNIGWVGRLKNYIEPQGFNNCVFNLGVPGDTSTCLLERFETEVKSRVRYIHRVDKFVIMIAIGTNDSKAIRLPDKIKTSPAEFKRNINKLIRIARKYTKNVIVVGLTPVDENKTNPLEDRYLINDRIVQYDEILKTSTKVNKTYFIDIHRSFIKLEYRKLLIDGLHPNKRGYDEMYRIIKYFLVKKKLIA
ncbi:MAG: GDSL-type esterase/lipase family protein [Candidatus Aenigmatarchaeota archaeon]